MCFVLFLHSGDDEFDDFPDTESPGEIILFKFNNPVEGLRTIALICTRKQQTEGFCRCHCANFTVLFFVFCYPSGVHQ